MPSSFSAHQLAPDTTNPSAIFQTLKQLMWSKVEERESGTAEKAMLIIMTEMREKTERVRALWSPYSLLRIIACTLAGADREKERDESKYRAAVTPLWFHSTSCLPPQCLCVLSPWKLPTHKYQRGRRERE